MVNTDESLFAFERAVCDTAYVVPEPAFMVSTQSTEKSMAMFRSWLKFRPILIYGIAFLRSKAQPQHNKSWNALLVAEYLSKMTDSVGGRSKQREEVKESMLSFLKETADEIRLSESPSDEILESTWHGLHFEQLKPEHFEQILWELSELNFRYEFQALDVRSRIGTPYEEEEAHTAIMSCFPDLSFSVPSLLTANHGIASDSQRERAHYLLAMARVMSKWRWADQNGWIALVGKVKWSADELEKLEKEIAALYTQSFYQCFRRAAVLPRRLSEAAVKACPIPGQHSPQMAPTVKNNPTFIVNLNPVQR